MAGALPSSILVHRAEVIVERAGARNTTWIEGEPGPGLTETSTPEPPAPAWRCVLFLPATGETNDAQQSWRPRTIQRPTLLWNPGDVVGDQPGKDAKMAVTAPDLATWTGADRVVWQVEGIPQPAGPPGTPVVVLATLKRVAD